MKLHLPSSLRKALLACLAAFAFPVSLPVTVGTGAAAVGSAVVFSVLGSQSLEAATQYTDGLRYSGDIYTYGNNGSTGLGSASGRQWYEDGSEGDSLTGGNFYGKFWSENIITNANTLRLAGATSNVTQESDWSAYLNLGGLIAEESDYTYEIKRTRIPGETQRLAFQTEGTGIVYASLQASVYFNASEAHVKSDADWRIAEGKTLTIEHRQGKGGVGIDDLFSIADGKTLTIRAYDGENGGTFILQGMETKLGSSAKLVVEQGASVELDSDVTFGFGAKLVVEQGASAEIGSNVTIAEPDRRITSIEVEGGTLEIGGKIDGRLSDVVVNDGILSVGGDAGNRSKIGSLSVNGGTATFEAFWESWGSLSATEGGKIVINDTTDASAGGITIYNNGDLIADNGSIFIAGDVSSSVNSSTGKIVIANGGKIAVGSPGESESYALYVSRRLAFLGSMSVGEGAIKVTAGGVLSTSGGSVLSGSSISVTGGGTYTAGKMSGSLTSISVVGTGSKVKLSEGSVFSLSGELNVSDGGVLEIGDNSVITVDVSSGGSIALSELASLLGTPDIVVSLPKDIDVGWEYQLFSGAVPTELKVDVGVAGELPRGLMAKYDEKTGCIYITGEATHAGDLVWEGGNYKWEAASDGWMTDEDDDHFYANDNVSFAGNKKSVVTVVDDVKPGKMTVSGSDYTFTGGSISVQGEDGLVITDGAGVEFETQLVEAEKISVGKDASVGIRKGAVQSGALEIGEGAMVTIATEGAKSFAEGVSVAQGAVLRIENKEGWKGAVSGDGTLELSIGGLETGVVDEAAGENALGDEGGIKSMLPGGDHHISEVRMVDNSLLQVTASAQHGQFASIGNLVITDGSVFALRSARGQINKDEHGFGSAKNTLTIEGNGGAMADALGTVYEGALLIGVAMDSDVDTTFYVNSNLTLSGDASVYVEADGGRMGVLSDFEDGGAYTSGGHTLTINGGGTLMLGKYFHTSEEAEAGAFNVKSGKLVLNHTESAALSGYSIHLTPGTQLALGGGDRTSAYTIGSLSGSGQLTLYVDNENAGEKKVLHFVNNFDACVAENEFIGTLDRDVTIQMDQGYQAIHTTLDGSYVMYVNGGTLDLNGLEKTEQEEPGIDELPDLDEEPDEEPTMAYGAGIANRGRLQVTVGAPADAAPDEPAAQSAEQATLLMQNLNIGAGAEVTLKLVNGGHLDMSRANMEEKALLEVESDGATADLTEITSESGVQIALVLNNGSAADMSYAALGAENELGVMVQDSELRMSGMTMGSDGHLTVTSMSGGRAQLSGASLGERAEVMILAQGGAVDMGCVEFAAGTALDVHATSGSVSLAGATFDMSAAPLPPEDGEAGDGGAAEPAVLTTVALDLTDGTHDLSNISAGENVRISVEMSGGARTRFTNTLPAAGLQLKVNGSQTIVEDMKMGLGTRIESETGLLTLAGKNSILLDSAMADKETLRIFSSSVRRLELVENGRLSVDISGVLSDIMSQGGLDVKFYIAETDLTAWKDQIAFGAELALLNLKATLGMDGSLSFQSLGVNDDTVYWSSRDNDPKNNKLWNAGNDVYASTDNKVAVYIDCDTTLNLRGSTPGYREDGLVLNNLMGVDGANFYLIGDGSGASKVTIANNLSRIGLDELEDVLGVQIDEVLTFDGNIDSKGVDVQIKHRDGDSGAPSENSTTLIKGRLTMSNGELQMTSGKLELAGEGSDLNGGISFAGNDAQIVADADMRIGGHIYLAGSGELDTTRQEHILFNNAGAVITLNDGAHVGAGVVIGNAFDAPAAEEGDLPEGELAGDEPADAPEEDAKPAELFAGTLSAEQGKQQMENGSRLSNVLLNLEAGSSLTVIGGVEEAPVVDEIAPAAEVWEEEEETPRVTADWALAGLTGEGALASTTDHQIDIRVAGKDREFSGDLSGYHGTMTVLASDHTQYFNGVTGGSGWNLTNTNGGRVEINLMGGSAPNHLTMGNLTLQSGSDTTILFDMPNTLSSNALLQLEGLTIEDDAKVTLGQYKGTISLRGTDGVYTRVLGTINVADDNISIGENVKWNFKGIRNASDVSLRVDENGNIVLEATVSNTNGFADFADNENSATGANLLWDVKNTYQIGGDLADLDGLLYDLIITDDVTPEKRAEANRVMAAAAGASTAVMSEAVSADMERQLRTIRNRTTNLSYSGDSYSRIRSGAWVNAESNYHKQGADGMMPGYKVTGWGGTVGAHTQLGESATVGVALTAMYSDLQSDGPDHLKGDMDTYYLSGFAQVAHEAWRHTFVLSVGRANLDVERTVAYANGGYTTKGSTDGVAFGAMYELGYTIPLNVDYSVCLQPVFNVAWRLNELGAYTETGSNAALHVEEQTYNAITFGVGARLQAAVGSNVWNRTGIFESRALLKVDVGDRQGQSTVALQEAGSFRGNVKSAEKGAVGVELGAGLALPTGRRGEVFVDGSAELRADYTNLNATIGYRINF